MLSERNKSKMLVIGFVGAVLVVVLLYFHFVIGRGMIRDYTVQAKNMEKEIVEARAELNEIQGLLDQQDELERQKARIQKIVRRLPSSPDAPGFLMALVSILRQTNIIQEIVKPEATQDRSQYTEIPYRVEAFGRYHEFGQFLTLVEQNPERFMRVKSFHVSNNMDRPSIHPIEMEIATFMFNK